MSGSSAKPWPQGAADPTWRATALAECLGQFAQVRLRVTGECMQPRLPAGETVLLVDARRAPPGLGDVVLRRHPAGLRLHRLVWVPPLAGGWRTRGDRSHAFDPALEPGDVLATVVDVGPGRGRPRSRRAALASLLRGLVERLWPGARA